MGKSTENFEMGTTTRHFAHERLDFRMNIVFSQWYRDIPQLQARYPLANKSMN